MGRRWGRVVAGAFAAVVLVAACGSDGSPSSSAGATPRTTPQPDAGRWRTWVLTRPDEIRVPPPPAAGSDEAEAELEAVRAAAARRTPADEREAHAWSDYPATEPWTRIQLDLVGHRGKNPPVAGRGYALVSVAVHDALVAAWHWKYVYDREPPTGTDPVVPPGGDPSYPSEHAVIAGAAARVLAYDFPELPESAYAARAEEAARSRITAGTNWPSDVEAGLALGRAVADRVIEAASDDRLGARWDGTIPAVPGAWSPPPGTPPERRQPVEPTGGSWDTWVVDPATISVPPPPAYGSPAYVAEARAVRDTGVHLTDEQKRIAQHWAAGAGTALPPGMWNELALEEVRSRRLTLPVVARAFALLNVAQHDAAIAAWRVKYEHWTTRPVNAIRDLGIDPGWSPLIPTPMFPSYVSGHSAFSAASSRVLGLLFPDDASRLRDLALEAGESRVLGGIHFPSDNVGGRAVGDAVGDAVVARARRDGVGPVRAAARTEPLRPAGGRFEIRG